MMLNSPAAEPLLQYFDQLCLVAFEGGRGVWLFENEQRTKSIEFLFYRLINQHPSHETRQ